MSDQERLAKVWGPTAVVTAAEDRAADELDAVVADRDMWRQRAEAAEAECERLTDELDKLGLSLWTTTQTEDGKG